MIVDWRPVKPTLVSSCPKCGNENIEAGVRIYLSHVVFENGRIIAYRTDFAPEEDAVRDAVIGDGVGFHDLDVYCETCGDLECLFTDTVA